MAKSHAQGVSLVLLVVKSFMVSIVCSTVPEHAAQRVPIADKDILSFIRSVACSPVAMHAAQGVTKVP